MADGKTSTPPALLHLALRPLPSSIPWNVRVRMLLKYAKRTLCLECTEIEPLTPLPKGDRRKWQRSD